MKIKQTLINTILPVISAIAVAGLAYAAWTEPGTTPPGNNVDAPINVGTLSQVKVGALGIGGLFKTFSTTILATDENGNPSGNVGIGTANPDVKLDVVGGKAQAEDFCLQDNSKCLSSGSGGVSFAGYSGALVYGDATVTGAGPAGGISGMTNHCNASYPGSRICTSAEFASIWVREKPTDTVSVIGTYYEAWVFGVDNALGDNCNNFRGNRCSAYWSIYARFDASVNPQFMEFQYSQATRGCCRQRTIACCYD